MRTALGEVRGGWGGWGRLVRLATGLLVAVGCSRAPSTTSQTSRTSSNLPPPAPASRSRRRAGRLPLADHGRPHSGALARAHAAARHCGRALAPFRRGTGLVADPAAAPVRRAGRPLP